jgi:hypothetical protein
MKLQFKTLWVVISACALLTASGGSSEAAPLGPGMYAAAPSP